MDKREIANKLVAEFGKMLTVEGLQLSEESNSCVLVFDGDIVLNIEYDAVAERMLFSVYLDELPQENAEPLLRELLAANLYWHRTRGATFCLEEGTGGIILVYPHSIDHLDNGSFETVVENVVQQAESWKGRIAGRKAEAEAAAQSPASNGPMMPGQTVVFG